MPKYPTLPIVSVDPGSAPCKLYLWEGKAIEPEILLNLRAELYWLIRQYFKDKRIKLYREDAELFAQLSIPWKHDERKNEKICLVPKKNLRIHYEESELGGESGSKSPDKADALCLATFGYTYLEQEQHDQAPPEEDVIIQPEEDGYFEIGQLGDF